MFKALMRVRLASFKTWFTGGTRSKKTKPSPAKAVGFALLMVYGFGCVGFMFWNYFSVLAAPLSAQGLGWLYFVLFAIAAFALIFVGSVFTAKSQLFEAKDNDLLLSLPIPPGKILLSRMTLLWLLGLLFDALVAIPAGLAWCATCAVTPVGVVAFVIVALLLPFFALALSSLFGWLLSLVAQRVRKKSLVTTVLSLAFLLLYMVFITRLNNIVNELAAAGAALAGSLGGIAPLYWLGAAIADGDLLSLLLTALWMLAPFFIAYYLLSRSFISTVTAHRGTAKVVYHEKRQAAVSPFRALYRRECQRFFTCSAYVMNGGLGAVFMVAGGVALVVLGPRLRAAAADMGGFAAYIPALLMAGICMMNGMTLVAACTISIEGRSLWILRSIPVASKDILRAKLLLHLTLALPASLAASLGAAIAVRAGLMQTLFLILLPLAYAVLTALIDLMANLRHPRLDWTNETQAVKSGVSVFIGMMLGWAGTLLAVGVFIVLKLVLRVPEGLCYLLELAVMAGLSALLYRWIQRRGVERFEEL